MLIIEMLKWDVVGSNVQKDRHCCLRFDVLTTISA